MYKFTDTTKQKCVERPNMPISAMNYDGVYLEDMFENYRTLSIEGREMIDVDLKTDNLVYGAKINSYELPPRILTVKYQLINHDTDKILFDYRNLINFLYRKHNVPIVFNDELDVYYQGRYQSSETVPGNTTSIVSSFQIYCESPFKHTVKTFETDGFIGFDTTIDTYPEKIHVEVNNSNKLTISNGQETISFLDKAVKKGDDIVIDFTSNDIWLNGVKKPHILELTSDFENFKLRQGSTLNCSNGKMSVFYKGVSL